MIRLIDVASVVRSKNAGPYELTLDVVFKSRRWFDHAVQIGLLNAERVSALYGMSPSDVLHVVHFEVAHAIKVTLRRPLVSGGVGDTDIYGAQQHAPLLGLSLDATATAEEDQGVLASAPQPTDQAMRGRLPLAPAGTVGDG